MAKASGLSADCGAAHAGSRSSDTRPSKMRTRGGVKRYPSPCVGLSRQTQTARFLYGIRTSKTVSYLAGDNDSKALNLDEVPATVRMTFSERPCVRYFTAVAIHALPPPSILCVSHNFQNHSTSSHGTISSPRPDTRCTRSASQVRRLAPWRRQNSPNAGSPRMKGRNSRTMTADQPAVMNKAHPPTSKRGSPNQSIHPSTRARDDTRG